VFMRVRTLGVSESGYYDWKGRPGAPRTLRQIWLAGETADVHKASGGTYGALRVTAELTYGREHPRGHGAVAQIMREIGIKGLPTRRLPRGAKVSKVTSLDLVRRSFRRDRPNELWVTDITEHPTREGRSTAPWCWTRFPGVWSAGRSTQPRAPLSCSTRLGWPRSAARTATGS
jgi:putative transposase